MEIGELCKPRLLGLYVNRAKLPRPSVRLEAGRIVFRVERNMFSPGVEQTLSVVCDPRLLKAAPRRAARWQGVPVFAVSFTPAPPPAAPR